MTPKRHTMTIGYWLAVALASACSDAGGDGSAPGGAAGTGAASGGAAGNPATGGATSNVGGGSSGSGGAVGGAAGSGGTTAGSGGAAGNGGVSGSGGAGAGGAAGSGGAAAAYGGVPPIDCVPWPAPGVTEELSETLQITAVLDGGMKRYVGVGALGSETQSEDQPALMRLADGAVLKNAVIGSPASDGLHCDGTCYLQNVWWEDVGEDAATLDGTSISQLMTIECAGARHAADKVFQHNGPGTMIVRDVYVEDFGKLYRSCGNCLEQYQRHARLENIVAEDGEMIAGVNENYGDTVELTNITVGDGITICGRWQGNDTGAEPSFVDDGADGEHCLYGSDDIHEL